MRGSRLAALALAAMIAPTAVGAQTFWPFPAAPFAQAVEPASSRSSPRHAARWPARLARVAADWPGDSGLFRLVTESAQRHGVPVWLAHAVVRVESGYRCGARSFSGARGIMQVLPASARAVGVAGDLGVCAIGLEAGMRYLRAAVDRGGPGCAGASLYNRGLGARPVCTGYGRLVMAHAVVVAEGGR